MRWVASGVFDGGAAMTYGMQTTNGANVLNIHEGMKAYVYLGKWAIPDQLGARVSVTINCAGYPMVFFGVPYNISNGDPGAGSNTGWPAFTKRHGISLTSLVPLGSNQWRLDLSVANPSSTALGLFVRVFGRLDLNYPTGSGQQFGMQVWDASSQIVFDSNLRMLRLAGNTYDTEIVLSPQNPSSSHVNSACDVVVNVLFDMQNKSICANARGVIYEPYGNGGYQDWDTGQWIDQYEILHFETLYWSTGSQLHARRIALGSHSYETPLPFVIDNSRCQTVYSRLAVIDNSLFP